MPIPFQPAQQRVAEQVGRYFNVYTATAGVQRFDYIVEAIKRGGAQKVLLGSDGPWLHPGVELHKIRVLGLSRKDEALVLGGNIIRLIRNVEVGRSSPIDLWPKPETNMCDVG